MLRYNQSLKIYRKISKINILLKGRYSGHKIKNVVKTFSFNVKIRHSVVKKLETNPMLFQNRSQVDNSVDVLHRCVLNFQFYHGTDILSKKKKTKKNYTC